MEAKYAGFNGKIIPIKDFHFSFADLSQDLGWARNWRVFDVIEARGDVLFHGDKHFERLFNSARHASLPIEEVDYVKNLPQLVKELLQANGLKESVVRVDITGGVAEPHGYATSSKSNVYVQISKAHPKDEVRELSFWTINYKREFPEIKTVNYYAACVAMQQAQRDGHHDVLFVDQDTNRILEPSRKNLFVVDKNGEILTPKEGVLPGITRGIIMKLAGDNGHKAREEEIRLDELSEAKEVFATSTTYFVSPVVKIAGLRNFNFEPGEITAHLSQLFQRYCDNYYKNHRST